MERPAGPVPEESTSRRSRRDQPASAAGADWTVHRVLQHGGRRYSLNLERPFWLALEDMARDRRLGVNRLVAQVAADTGEAANLASRVRAFCVSELRQRAQRGRFSLQPANVIALAESSPFPGLVVSATQEVLLANGPFSDWLGAPGQRLVGRRIQRNFRFRFSATINDLWRAFREGRAAAEHGRIVSIVPGRVRAADATLQPIQFGAIGDFVCFVWLQLARATKP